MAAATTSHPPTAASTAPSQSTAAATAPTEASTKFAEAIDEFLANVEKKFKPMSEEMLSKLDDMAERCDRLEQEMLVRDERGRMEGKPGQDSAVDDRS